MNLIFLIFLTIACLAVWRSWRRLNRAAERTKRTSVPGYSITSGAEFGLDADASLQKETEWTVVSIEEVHSRSRSRVVLSFDVSPESTVDQIRELVSQIARKVVERTRANVVLAEVSSGDQERAAYLLAPDGGGWNGEGAPPEIFVPAAAAGSR